MKLKFNFQNLAFFLLLAGVSCSGLSRQNNSNISGSAVGPRVIENQFTLFNQTLAAQNIHSLQLYRGSPGAAPILELGTSQTLTLKFDEVASGSSSYMIEITHHNADWSQSNLIQNFYLQGFFQDYFGEGEVSRYQNPSYYSYTYTFPNRNMRITRSGNFMVHVYNQSTNQKVFSLPFLVHENTGTLETDFEELYNLDTRYLRHHQLFARYRYEDTSVMPQIDLSVYFVQNQFWSQARKAGEQDYSEAGIARLYLSRDQAFVGTFESLSLDMTSLDQYSMQIVEIAPGMNIPRVTLNRDVVNLRLNPTVRRTSTLNSPLQRRDARYGLVRFQLEIPELERTSWAVYLVGGFNNWSVNPAHRLYRSSDTGYYTTEAVVKEGVYAYKYVTVENNRVNELRFDASFASTRQEYHTLIYRRDQAMQYDRLVLVGQFWSE